MRDSVRIRPLFVHFVDVLRQSQNVLRRVFVVKLGCSELIQQAVEIQQTHMIEKAPSAEGFITVRV